jgi:hypothetical protein
MAFACCLIIAGTVLALSGVVAMAFSQNALHTSAQI